MTNNVRFTMSVSDNYIYGLLLVLSKTNTIFSVQIPGHLPWAFTNLGNEWSSSAQG